MEGDISCKNARSAQLKEFERCTRLYKQGTNVFNKLRCIFRVRGTLACHIPAAVVTKSTFILEYDWISSWRCLYLAQRVRH